jgi:hypothetical protein
MLTYRDILHKSSTGMIIVISSRLLPAAEDRLQAQRSLKPLDVTDDLLALSPAAALGKRGGKVTAKRVPDYFRKIAGMRKTHGGGRPPSKSRPN